MKMGSKAIMFCSGPLSGRQEMVDERMEVYRFFEQPKITSVNVTAPLTIKEGKYYKSKYKFGEFEIFVWEGDIAK